ncbi:ATP-binding response regulator, partial [Roseobacter sinensis]
MALATEADILTETLPLSRTLQFANEEDETRFRALYFATAAEQFPSAVVLALVLLIGFGAFDYYVLSGGQAGPLLWKAWAARATLCLVYAVAAHLTKKTPPDRLPLLVMATYLPTIALIWWLTVLGPPPGTLTYLYAFTLVSLAGLTLIPYLFAHALVVQPLFLLPFVHCAVRHQGGFTDAMADIGFPLTILLSTILFGLHAKFHSEQELRRNYLQSRRLAEARDKATAADRAKTGFLAIVSHELRSPLNAILGNLELLKNRSDRSAEDFRIAASSAGRTMASLVDDILAFAARNEAGPGKILSEPFRPSEVLKEILFVFGGEKDPNQAAEILVNRIDAGTVRGDPGRLRHILLNLVGNAVKFANGSEVCIRLRIGNDRLVFVVADHGPGIPNQVRNSLFDPYTKGDPMAPGVGLGLSIVAMMVRDLNGQIRVRSRVGKGTVFRVTLPFPQVFDELPRKPQANDKPSRTLRLLVVDDEAVGRSVLTGLLRRDGHRVEEAESVDEALSIACSLEPDAILTDLRMPKRSGYDLASDPAVSKIPVVAVTANVLADGRPRNAFAAVIPKPVDTVVLRSVLSTVTKTTKPIQTLSSLAVDALKPAEQAQVIGSFLENLDATIAVLTNVDTAEALREAAHRVRGLLATMGYLEEASIAARLEEKATQSLGATSAERAELLEALHHLSFPLRTGPLKWSPKGDIEWRGSDI